MPFLQRLERAHEPRVVGADDAPDRRRTVPVQLDDGAGVLGQVPMRNSESAAAAANDSGDSPIPRAPRAAAGQPGSSTLGVGALSGGGISNGAYVFSFDVPVPSGQSVYTVTISHRGTQTFTADQGSAADRALAGQLTRLPGHLLW